MFSLLLFLAAVPGALANVRRDERGQTTAEYALVLLVAAAVALLAVGWATKSGKVTELLDGVMDKILGDL